MRTVLLDISHPAGCVSSAGPPDTGRHPLELRRPRWLAAVEAHETEAGLPVYYDISRPSQPRQLATFSVEGFDNDTVHGSLGVAAANSAIPSQPRLRAQFVPDTDYVNPDFFCSEACVQGEWPWIGGWSSPPT